jgi:hypothetical protein
MNSTVNERIGLKSTVEPRVTCPKRRLFGQVESPLTEISEHCGRLLEFRRPIQPLEI